MGDLVGVLLVSTHGDSSMALLGSLKMGRLGESPVNLSMVPSGAVVKGFRVGSLGSLEDSVLFTRASESSSKVSSRPVCSSYQDAANHGEGGMRSALRRKTVASSRVYIRASVRIRRTGTSFIVRLRRQVLDDNRWSAELNWL